MQIDWHSNHRNSGLAPSLANAKAGVGRCRRKGLGLARLDLKRQKLSESKKTVPGPSPQVLGTTWVPKAGEMVCGGFACSKNALCALNVVYMTDIINASWRVMSNKTRNELERSFDCCGLFNLTTLDQQDYAFCTAICKSRSPSCQMCGEKFLRHSDEALKILGGVGLFFSFTEILGVWLAMRFRNQKDPRANPSAFL
uniref:Tetraspanin 31 n=2 Tax=Sus scrofa TaxID=9823 RepID=A0A5G2QU36_PIG